MIAKSMPSKNEIFRLTLDGVKVAPDKPDVAPKPGDIVDTCDVYRRDWGMRSKYYADLAEYIWGKASCDRQDNHIADVMTYALHCDHQKQRE